MERSSQEKQTGGRDSLHQELSEPGEPWEAKAFPRHRVHRTLRQKDYYELEYNLSDIYSEFRGTSLGSVATNPKISKSNCEKFFSRVQYRGSESWQGKGEIGLVSAG